MYYLCPASPFVAHVLVGCSSGPAARHTWQHLNASDSREFARSNGGEACTDHFTFSGAVWQKPEVLLEDLEESTDLETNFHQFVFTRRVKIKISVSHILVYYIFFHDMCKPFRSRWKNYFLVSVQVTPATGLPVGSYLKWEWRAWRKPQPMWKGLKGDVSFLLVQGAKLVACHHPMARCYALRLQSEPRVESFLFI